MNIMLIPPNTFKMQPAIDILWIIMNWMSHHMSIIMLGLFILMCLSIENPNKKWIDIKFVIKATFAMYVTIWSFCLLLIFIW
jgi:hypothetical protein